LYITHNAFHRISVAEKKNQKVLAAGNRDMGAVGALLFSEVTLEGAFAFRG